MKKILMRILFLALMSGVFNACQPATEHGTMKYGTGIRLAESISMYSYV